MKNDTLDDLKTRCIVPEGLHWLGSGSVDVNLSAGRMADSLLKKKLIHEESYDEDGVLHDVAHVVEYWFEGVCVHRSVDMDIKRMPEGMGTLVGMMAK